MSSPSPAILFPLVLALLCLPSSSAHAAHFPDPVPTSQAMTLSAAVTVDGLPLSPGDEVAAYSVHPVPGAPGKWERTLVGRHVAGAGGATVSMPVYGDDPSTPGAVEGAVAGEEIGLVLWRTGEGKEYPAYRTPAGSPLVVTWSSGAVGTLDIDFTSGERIPLRNSAWNLFSYGVLHGYQALNRPVPTAAQLPGVAWDNVPTLGDAFPLQSIAGKYDRLLGNDGTGTTFWNPALPGVSSMAYLAPGYGYWVKMKASAEPLSWLTVPGTRTLGTESLLLNPGWTLAGYWGWPVYHVGSYAPWDGLYPVDVYDNAALPSIRDLWSSLGSDYVRVMSFDGSGAHLWNPSQPTFSTMKYLAPGYGYWVKMSRPGTLAYPATGPSPPTVATLPASGIGTENAVLNGTVNPNGAAAEGWFEWGSDPSLVSITYTTPRQAVGSGATAVSFGATVPGLTPGATYYYRAAASSPGGTVKGSIVSFVTASPGLPPDPGTVAPPVSLTSPTSAYESTRFLYEGAPPIQTGVSPGTIDPRRAAVLRGKVTTREGSPLPGVRVTVLNHPEYGQTLSRADGMFDLAANGGGYLTVSYERTGYLPAQRQVEVPWREYAHLPDVALVTLDPQATAVDLTSPAPIQVARGSVVTDGDGTRRATLLFAQGTTAQMVMPDNTTVPLTSLTVRATEYTVGANGPRSMPAELPPTSGYTYAVELSADEAIAAGAETVRFDRPVYQYVENFLNFPVGMVVPTGYYDRKLGSWLPSQNGRVVRVLAIDNGLATLDTDGDGAVDNAARLASLNVTDAERVQLATLYGAGTSLWRVPIPHLTPWDCNWPSGPPPDAVPPRPRKPPEPPKCTDRRSGSVIDCQNQTLIESVGVTGTPFSLNYASDRVAGRKDNYTVRIPVSEATLPASLRKIRLGVFVEGRNFTYEFPPAPDQFHEFTWDGRDAYGNVVQGPQTAYIRVEYVYPLVYTAPTDFENAFARLGTTPIETVQRTGTEMSLVWRMKTTLGAWRVPPNGLGGWTLNAHHAYDPVGSTLYLGDGGKRSSAAEVAPQVLRTVAGGGSTYAYDPSAQGMPADNVWGLTPRDVALGPDGSAYVIDSQAILRIAPDGTFSTITVDGIVGANSGITVDRAGNVFFLVNTGGGAGELVRKFGTDNVTTTVAGGGSRPVCRQESTNLICDRIPSTEALFSLDLTDVTAAPDGSLYVSDRTSIYKISSDGYMEFVAGWHGISSGPPGAFIYFSSIGGLTVGGDGSVYVVDTGTFNGWDYSQTPNQIVRLRPDGRIEKIAGSYMGFGGDGGPAASAVLKEPADVAVAADGSVYIADTGNNRVRRVAPDGFIDTVAGNGTQSGSWSAIPPVRVARDSGLYMLTNAAISPDGKLYICDLNLLSVLESPFAGGAGGEIRVASGDGREVYYFDGTGRHLRTVHALTGAILLEFAYDPQGRLVRVTDGDGNVTTVERDASGSPTALVAPFGQRTALALDPEGLLSSVSNPAGVTHRMTYTPDALLASFADPLGNASTFQYDGMGRLVRDEDAAGGFQSLARTGNPGNFEVSVATALGRTTTYAGEDLLSGTHRKVVTDPAGGRTETLISPVGVVETRTPDGMVTVMKKGADPRFGMEAPLLTSIVTRTPSGLERAVTRQRSANLASQGDPFSIQTQTDTVTVNGRSYMTTYDGATRAITRLTAIGRERSTTVDDRGRLISSRLDPSLIPLDISYNSSGLPAQVSRGNQFRTFGYDPLGRLVTRTDSAGNTLGFGYDGSDRISGLTLPSGREYRFAYDPNGNLAQVMMPSGAIHALGTTAINLDNIYTPPESAPYRWSYDTDRSWVRTTLPGGRTIDASHDFGGRPTGWAYPEAQVDITYAPGDNTSRVHRVVRTPVGGGPVQENSLEYDGRLVTGLSFSGASNGRCTYAHDNNFFLTEFSLYSGSDNVRIGLTRDADGLTIQYGRYAWTREGPAGEISRIADGALDVLFSYDGMGRIGSRAHVVNGVPAYQIQVSYDNVGRIAQKIESTAGVSRTYDYSYDLDGQLTGVTRDGTTFERYGYDVNGNRTMRQDGAAPPVTAAYDNQDRLVQSGGVAYQYDADGYLVQRGTDTFRYSARGELLETAVGTQTVTYAYDGGGRCVARTGGSGTMQYLYGNTYRPFQLTASRDAAGQLTLYHYAQDRLFAMDRGGSRYYVATDQVGTPRVVTDSTGAVIKVVDSDSYGNILNDNNAAFFLPVGFAGGLKDPVTGMVRFGYRDYDPGAGRWTAIDPIFFRGGDFNLYLYAGNDPAMRKDRSGLAGENTGGQTGDATGDDGFDPYDLYDQCVRYRNKETECGTPSDLKKDENMAVCAQLTGLEANLKGYDEAMTNVMDKIKQNEKERYDLLYDFVKFFDPENEILHSPPE